ncbi:MAG: diguanylate cyclase [Synergistota bacterium]|nr:diguanylate cyclase [Synergistota bacterium]
MERLERIFLISIAASLLLVIFAGIVGIYLPMSNVVKGRSQKVFMANASLSAVTLNNFMLNSMESARSLSEKRGLRELTTEYLEGAVSFEKLRKGAIRAYLDVVPQMRNFMSAVRVIDDEFAAALGDFDPEMVPKRIDYSRVTADIRFVRGKYVVTVVSPVWVGRPDYGVDIITFDMSEILKELEDGGVSFMVYMPTLDGYVDAAGEPAPPIRQFVFEIQGERAVYSLPVSGTASVLSASLATEYLYKEFHRLNMIIFPVFLAVLAGIALLMGRTVMSGARRMVNEHRAVNERLRDALEQSEMWEGKLQAMLRDLGVLSNLSDLVTRSDVGVSSLGETISSKVRDELRLADLVTLVLLSPGGGRMRIQAFGGGFVNLSEVPLEPNNLPRDVLKDGSELYVPSMSPWIAANTGRTCYIHETRPDINTCLFLPLTLDEHVAGLIVFGSLTENAFDEGLREIFRVIAHQVEVALRLKGVFESVEEERSRYRDISNTDALTEARTRSFFYEWIKQHIAELKRKGLTSSLVLFDVDDFKEINDNWGHPEGDRVLRAIADAMKNNAREMDLVIRWGGDEFLVFLPGAELEQANVTAKRIVQAVEAIDSFPFGLGVSSGVSRIGDDFDIEKALTEADEAMYRDKKARRKGR